MIAPDFLTVFYYFGVFLRSFISLLGAYNYWLYTHRKFGLGILHRLRAFRYGYSLLPEQEGHLADRIENPGEYHTGNLTNFTSLK